MSKLVEYRERMTSLLTELGTLHGKESRSADDEARIDTVLAEVNTLGPQIDRERDIEAATARTALYTEPTRQPIARMVPTEGAEAAQRIDRRSLGQRFAESDEFKAYAANPGGKGQAFAAESFRPQEARTLIGTGALPADMILPQQVPGIFRGMEAPLRMRDVLLGGRTTSDAITFMRELVYTNAAVEVAQATTTSNGAKPESALTFEQATANVVTIAHWIPITRQTLEDVPQMQTYVEGRLLTGLARREDNQILNGNGTPPNMLGILATTGVQVADATYFSGAAVLGAGAAPENANRIRRAKRLVQVTGDALASFVAINPTDLEKLDTQVDTTMNYLFAAGGPEAGGFGGRTLWGLRIVETENIAAGTVLVGDGTMAAVWDRMDARIYVTDSHSDFFIRNIFVLLAEERLALTVYRPTAFVVVTLV